MTSEVVIRHIDFIKVGDILVFDDRPKYLLVEYLGVQKHGPRFVFKIFDLSDQKFWNLVFPNRVYQVIRG